MKIALASDHGGFNLKNNVKKYLLSKGFEVLDLGCDSNDSVDYPDFAAKAANEVLHAKADRAILVCGTGIGMAISANKIKGIRAASIFDPLTARLAREHNDLNVLCLGERIIGLLLAEAIIDEFLNTPFLAGRHSTRVNKISQLEKD